MIRAGIHEDLDFIVSMAREFWKQTIFDDPFCDETVKQMATMCLEQDLLSVIQTNNKVVGFACGLKGSLLGNASIGNGVEVAWWVDPRHRKGKNGIALLRHLENLAKKAGLKYWSMSYMQSSMPVTVKHIYEKMGYQKNEVTYTKVL